MTLRATNGDDGTPDGGPAPTSRRRGIALISVLWVLVLLSLIAASFSFTSRTEVNLARNMVDNAEAEALADAGVYRAIAGLYKTVGQGGFRVDRTVYGWRFEDGEVRFEIADEGGKIDLNRATEAVLGALFRTFDLSDQEADALVDAVADFRDADDDRRPNGAEDDDYLAAGLKHDAKDGPFEAVEELQQVLGMDRELYRLAAPALTVYSRRRAPHLAIAPPEVQAAMAGMKESARGRRRERNQQAAEQSGAAAPAVDLPDQVEILVEGPSTARSRAKVYTIHSEARTANGAMFAREAVVRVAGGRQPYRVHVWRRALGRLFEISVAEDDAGG